MSKLVEFKASNFKGNNNKAIIVDEEFVPYLRIMNDLAVKHKMMVIVTSSHRTSTKVAGAIVVPAQKSNHLVGHAIDCNLQNITTGEYYNSKLMADDKGADYDFCMDVVVKTGLRWGDAFNVPDSVHFDDGLNIKNPTLWEQKYKDFIK